MALTVNIRHLENKDLHLVGEIKPEELELVGLDELIGAQLPVKYDLDVQLLDHSILVQGTIQLELSCECARCLKQFQHPIEMEDWTCHLPLEGEEAVPVANDLVDLTPMLREDILLRLPQHPLCEPECGGHQKILDAIHRKSSAEQEEGSSPWSELNKLKL